MEEEETYIEHAQREKSFLARHVTMRHLVMIGGVLAGLLIIYLFITLVANGYEGCKSWDCFNENLAACEKTKFAGGSDIIFGYTIEGEGESENTCVVHVEFLQGEIADYKTRNLIHKKMTCELPLGVTMLPESDLSFCTGTLKEELQSQVIDQLHNFIIQNLGQINKELLNPLNYTTKKNSY